MAVQLITRALRTRYGISSKELADSAGVSKARIIFIEGPDNTQTEHQLHLLQRAYENLIQERKKRLLGLEHDYMLVKQELLTYGNIEFYLR